MRKIKFKAWDIMRSEFLPNDIDICIIAPDGTVIINRDNCNSYSEDIILLQFTGLIDENGIPVYEGDIFDKGYKKGVIVFCERPFQLGWVFIPLEVYQDYLNGENPVDIDSIFDFPSPSKKDLIGKVIGNIYKNPEMVEGDIL